MRCLFVAAILVIAAASPAFAACDRQIDSTAFDDGQNSSWCWMSGKICYYCWGATPQEQCASNWEPCDTSPPKPVPEPGVLIATERSISARPCAAKTLESGRQVKAEHVL